MDFIRSTFVLLCVVFLTRMAVSVAMKRKLLMKPIPCQTTNLSKSFNVIHVRAQADDNSSTIHYFWTTYPVPTIVIAYTTFEYTTLKISCENLTLHSEGINFFPPVNYTIGFSIPTIYEFEDDDDKADLNDNDGIITHKLESGITWQMEIIDNSSVTFTGNEAIIFKCIASDSEGRESLLPHAKHTADSSRFSLSLNNMNVTTNKTRFAFELNYIVHLNHTPTVTTVKSIDDEYTPAVFETVYGKVHGKNGKAFSQWKPIAYTLPELGRKYQTRASASDIQKVVNTSWTIAEAVVSTDKYEIYGVNVSFGLAQDGFYQKNNYLTWSGIIGYGDPAGSSLSFFVIMIISVGLGLPLGIIIFGGTYVQIRKRCCKTNEQTSYARIN